MRAAVVTFPGANRDRDLVRAFRDTGYADVHLVWHEEIELPLVDVVGIPGGFSYGDYLRCGAIAARSPVMRAVAAFAEKGGHVLGVCNGFQILCEAGLLPGALVRNVGLRFICHPCELRVERTGTAFTRGLAEGDRIMISTAHGDGNYTADEATLERLEGEGRVLFRYVDNPNGSVRNIAGITDATGRVLGLMPHPECHVDPRTGHTGGRAIFHSILETVGRG
jgi:phosphoribosylformylglycinamidine synthase I